MKNLIKCFAVLAAMLVFTGCASRRGAEIATDPISAQLNPTAGMKAMDVAVVMEDKRPNAVRPRYGSSSVERPEFFFDNYCGNFRHIFIQIRKSK